MWIEEQNLKTLWKALVLERHLWFLPDIITEVCGNIYVFFFFFLLEWRENAPFLLPQKVAALKWAAQLVKFNEVDAHSANWQQTW